MDYRRIAALDHARVALRRASAWGSGFDATSRRARGTDARLGHPHTGGAVILLAVLILLGCAPRPSTSVIQLDPNTDLLSPLNAAWRAEHDRKLADFKRTERATLWAVRQALRGGTSTAWPPPAAPIRLGTYEYFAEDGPGNRYPIFYRRAAEGRREVVLDLNREFPNSIVDIGLLRISPDNSNLAISLDTGATGIFQLFTRTIPDGQLVGPIGTAVHEAEWSADGDLFFSELEGLRATTIHRVRPTGEIDSIPLSIGTDGHLALHPSGDGQMIVREIAPHGGTVWRLQRIDREIRPLSLAVKGAAWRSAAMLDGCSFGDDALVLVERAQRRELVWSRKKDSPNPSPLSLGAEESQVMGIRCFKRHVVAFGRAENRGALWYLSVDDDSRRLVRVVTPFGLTALSLGAHPSPEVSVVRVQLSSLINPPILYELDLTTGVFSPRAQMEVTNHYPPRYTTVQLAARASDGVSVPITVAYRLDDSSRTPRPLTLTTYGAYGAIASTEFDDFYLPLLEQGVVVAVAHIRGGGEGGPAWHAASRGMTKAVGTSDLIAAAEELHRLGWGDLRRTALLGRSAGAIPVAGAAALRPELFGAVVLDAPFLDPVQALRDTSRPLVRRERSEWGDPSDSIMREAMLRYAPFDLPVTGDHPPTLVTAHANDVAVPPLDGARWIERLESLGASGHLLSLTAGTHAGPSTRSATADEAALRATFILVHVGRH